MKSLVVSRNGEVTMLVDVHNVDFSVEDLLIHGRDELLIDRLRNRSVRVGMIFTPSTVFVIKVLGPGAASVSSMDTKKLFEATGVCAPDSFRLRCVRCLYALPDALAERLVLQLFPDVVGNLVGCCIEIDRGSPANDLPDGLDDLGEMIEAAAIDQLIAEVGNLQGQFRRMRKEIREEFRKLRKQLRHRSSEPAEDQKDPNLAGPFWDLEDLGVKSPYEDVADPPPPELDKVAGGIFSGSGVPVVDLDNDAVHVAVPGDPPAYDGNWLLTEEEVDEQYRPIFRHAMMLIKAHGPWVLSPGVVNPRYREPLATMRASGAVRAVWWSPDVGTLRLIESVTSAPDVPDMIRFGSIPPTEVIMGKPEVIAKLLSGELALPSGWTKPIQVWGSSDSYRQVPELDKVAGGIFSGSGVAVHVAVPGVDLLKRCGDCDHRSYLPIADSTYRCCLARDEHRLITKYSIACDKHELSLPPFTSAMRDAALLSMTQSYASRLAQQVWWSPSQETLRLIEVHLAVGSAQVLRFPATADLPPTEIWPVNPSTMEKILSGEIPLPDGWHKPSLIWPEPEQPKE